MHTKLPIGCPMHRTARSPRWRADCRFGFIELGQAPTRVCMRRASSSIRRGTCTSRSARHQPSAWGCGGQTAVGTEWFGAAGIGNLLLWMTGRAAESYRGQTVADSNTPRLPATSARNETAGSRRATTALPQLGIDNQHWDAPPKPRVIDTDAALSLTKQRSPGSPPIRATCDKGSGSVPAVG